MSDFDEEAERERLREQYEHDQKKRETTEKMSDLLLKGATMTNAHCQECNDPIFRYDGREFCPTCQRVVADDEGESDAGGAASGGDAGGAETGADAGTGSGEATANGDDPHIEMKSPTGPPATTADAVEESPGGSTDPAGGASRESADRPTGADAPSGTGPARTGPDAAGGASPDPEERSASTPQATATGQGAASLSTARESLVQTLTAQARLAEACEDPRQARDHLAAAREAAETLAALSI